jgi:hypothetical protein
MWCVVHHISPIAILIATFIAVALVGLLVGGSIAGWDIKGFIVSPTGALVGVIIILSLLGFSYYYFTNRR